MVRIRRFGIMKTATTVAAIYVAVIAIFAVPVVLLVTAAGGMSTGTGTVGSVEVLTFALVAMIAYGLLGWVFTAIACAVYNLAARFTGGIEVQVDHIAPPPAPPVWGPAPDSTPAAPNVS